MIYPQAKRILYDLAADSRCSAAMALECARLLEGRLPHLGPYGRLSAEAVLHRLASNAKSPPRARLAALRKLLLSPEERQVLKELENRTEQ